MSQPSPSYSDFARFEDRVEETIDKKVDRVEDKLDEIARAVARLMLFEQREEWHKRRFDEIDKRLAGALDAQHTHALQLAALRLELHGYVQRYLGAAAAVSVIAGGAFALALRLVN